MSVAKWNREDLDESTQSMLDPLLEHLQEYGAGDGCAESAVLKAIEAVYAQTRTYMVTYTVTQKATYTIEVEAKSEEDAVKQVESGDVDPADGDEQETDDIELDEVLSAEAE